MPCHFHLGGKATKRESMLELDARTLSGWFVWKSLIQRSTGPARSKTAMLADHRIRIMNEVVSGIRIIKMYAWEIPFSTVVTAVRR